MENGGSTEMIKSIVEKCTLYIYAALNICRRNKARQIVLGIIKAQYTDNSISYFCVSFLLSVPECNASLLSETVKYIEL